MKVLQLDVDKISYKPVKPEASVYEESDDAVVEESNAVVMLVSIEKGDDEDVGKMAVKESLEFAKKEKEKVLVIYPYAHLSDKLSGLESALNILKAMRAEASKESSIKVVSAPFGWNKKLMLDIKGHPLAEESHSYSNNMEKGNEVKSELVEHELKIDTSIVRKSDWSNMPDTDHRTIGERQDLYSFQEVSPAMVYWHPKGFTIYKELINLMRHIEYQHDYQEISTPELTNIALYQVSGHLQHYKENMFMFNSSIGDVSLKPMNCPSTILIYKTRKWSYKDLPWRTAIFDKLHRSELSGVASGLFRVKGLTQDDGHIFAREDQIKDEISDLLHIVKEVYGGIFKMQYHANLSTMPDDHMGDLDLWDRATKALKDALDENEIKYDIKDKDGAFYGPKIDFDIKDSMGRLWQCATIQLDYQLPRNFKLEYTDNEGKSRTPVIIHRAILGSLERFTAIMVEHYQGKFPLWLSPIQVRVLSLSEGSNEYASNIYKTLKDKDIRSELDISDRTIEYKIRDGKLQQIPYLLIIGKKEMEKNSISIRDRSGIQSNNVKLDDFISGLNEKVSSRSNEL
ncbi:threonyl-tRNA synthetase [Candidatus Mancarchaeum acidiphilum]|uniref:Threonine--tRNA ligase n=1 Tax=Candidatus Mancarchaeum acidiphilum TaxID=1920749 RepID=A0A218NLW2_9ARCH|nr:threonine--tRNA ligase [Candidatus Mancarchaeum acidiphilum]ASI13459.1 threonyl-tRNA synthetase [Candidatus Mancarchaeum acidiphilum]